MAEYESAEPEAEMLAEMQQAVAGLEQVVESVQQAAALCPNCADPVVAAQAPVVESMAMQAAALLEMVDAEVAVLEESVGAEGAAPPAVGAMVDVVA